MKQKNVLILSLVTAAALGVAAIALRSQATEASLAGRPRLFPELFARINELAELRVEKGGNVATLRREGAQWKLADRGGYPALFEKVKELAVRVATLEIDEPKTAKKENHPRLVVEWPPDDSGEEREGEPGLITLKDANGTELAALVVGKSEWRGDSPKVYVRRVGEDQVYLCSSRQTLEVDPGTRRWIDAKLIELANDRIQDVSIEHVDGERIEIGRSAANHTQFVVQNLPLGQSERYEGIANGVAQALSSISLEDVRLAGEVDFTKEPRAKTRFRCVDGLELLVETAKVEEKTWVRIAASYTAPPEAVSPTTEGTEGIEGAEPSPAGETEAGEKKDVAKEALELSERLAPWVFDVGSYKADLLARRMQDFLPEPSDAAVGDDGLEGVLQGFDLGQEGETVQEPLLPDAPPDDRAEPESTPTEDQPRSE